jgi:hypothetical protein
MSRSPTLDVTMPARSFQLGELHRVEAMLRPKVVVVVALLLVARAVQLRRVPSHPTLAPLTH